MCLCFPEAVCRIFLICTLCKNDFLISFLLRKSAEPRLLFQHQSATLLFMETFKNWSQRKRSQMFHSSLQTGLGRPYSVDRLMFFHLSQNYALHSCHLCWRRGLLETSEAPRSYVPSYNGILARCKMEMRLEIHWPEGYRCMPTKAQGTSELVVSSVWGWLQKSHAREDSGWLQVV
jgi:hypothetical protein